MSSDRAELDSATTILDDLTRRVSAIADLHQEAGDEATATDLYDVERALKSASRKLANVVRHLEA